MLDVLNEWVKTAAARSELARREREIRALQAEFPPRPPRNWQPELLAGLGFVAVLWIVTVAMQPRLPARAPVAPPARAPSAPTGVPLQVTSDRPDTWVQATWAGGHYEAKAPFILYPHRGARVRLVYNTENSQPYIVEVMATAEQVVVGHVGARSLEIMGDFE
jgi:hypothetical protein